NSFGPYSETMRIVLDLVPPPTAPNPNINVPVGSNRVVVQIIHIPGFPDGSFPFTATVDKPWLQVSPASGILPPDGIDLTVTADPTRSEERRVGKEWRERRSAVKRHKE